MATVPTLFRAHPHASYLYLVGELVKVEEVRSGCGSFRHLGQNVGHKRPHRAHGLDCSCRVAGNQEGVIGM